MRLYSYTKIKPPSITVLNSKIQTFTTEWWSQILKKKTLIEGVGHKFNAWNKTAKTKH